MRLPWTSVISTCESGYPIQTDVTICGEYPMYQASRYFWVVPVFAANVRPKAPPVAVPRSASPSRKSVIM